MIVRNRRKQSGFMSRLSRSFSRIKPPAGFKRILPTDQFQLEIDKEIQRSNRRKLNPEFAIISIDFCDHKVPDNKLDWLTDEFMNRLRVSDSIGWHHMKLGVLLPETGVEGASMVRDSLLQIACENEVDLDANISIYPWDDKLFGDNDHRVDNAADGFDPPNWESASVSRMSGLQSSETQTCVLEPPRAVERTMQPKRGTGVRLAFGTRERTPAWKRTLDIVAAGTGLALLSPIFLVVAVAIKTTSKGPVFFSQQREGKDANIFNMLKFRTMCVDAEEQKADLRELSEQDGPAFKLTNDPRVTTVGKYLRKSCIDELPQLYNILTGHMSLVGPRPLPVDESMGCLPWQRQRLAVLPGLTCIWQARGGRDIKFSEWMRMDLDYIEQRGLWFDLKLIGETAVVAVMHKGSV